MIRALVLVSGLLIGLTAAVSLGGRMAHLRMIALADLPGWTRNIAPDAGLMRGHAAVAGADLRWHLAGVDGGGPRWAVSLSEEDWQGQAVMRAGWDGLRFEAVTGLLPGAVLEPDGRGALAISDGSLELPWHRDPALTGWIEGRANALTLESGGLPRQGALRIEATPDGWRVAAP